MRIQNSSGQDYIIQLNPKQSITINSGTTYINDNFYKRLFIRILCNFYSERPGILSFIKVLLENDEEADFQCVHGANIGSCFCLKTRFIEGNNTPKFALLVDSNNNNTDNNDINFSAAIYPVESDGKGLYVSIQNIPQNIDTVDISFEMCQNLFCRKATHVHLGDNNYYIKYPDDISLVNGAIINVEYVFNNTFRAKRFLQSLDLSNINNILNHQINIDNIYLANDKIIIKNNIPQLHNGTYSNYHLIKAEVFLYRTVNNEEKLYGSGIMHNGTIIIESNFGDWALDQYKAKFIRKYSIEEIDEIIILENELIIDLNTAQQLFHVVVNNVIQNTCYVQILGECTIILPEFEVMIKSVELEMMLQLEGNILEIHKKEVPLGQFNFTITKEQNIMYDNILVRTKFIFKAGGGYEISLSPIPLVKKYVIALFETECGKYETVNDTLPPNLYEGPFITTLKLFSNTNMNNIMFKAFFIAGEDIIDEIFEVSNVNANYYSYSADITSKNYSTYYSPSTYNTVIRGKIYCNGQQRIEVDLYDMSMPKFLFAFSEVFNANGDLVSINSLQPFINTIPFALVLYPGRDVMDLNNMDYYVAIGYTEINDLSFYGSELKDGYILIDNEKNELKDVFYSQVILSYHNSSGGPGTHVIYPVKILYNKNAFVVYILDQGNNKVYSYLFNKIKNKKQMYNRNFLSSFLLNNASKAKKIIANGFINNGGVLLQNLEIVFNSISLNVSLSTPPNVYFLALFYPPIGIQRGVNIRQQFFYNPYAYSVKNTVNYNSTIYYFDRPVFLYLSSNNNQRYIRLISNVVNSGADNTPTRAGMRNQYVIQNNNAVTYYFDSNRTNVGFSAMIGSGVSQQAGTNIFAYTSASSNFMNKYLLGLNYIIVFGAWQGDPHTIINPVLNVIPDTVYNNIISKPARTDQNINSDEFGFQAKSISFGIHIKKHIKIINLYS